MISRSPKIAGRSFFQGLFGFLLPGLCAVYPAALEEVLRAVPADDLADAALLGADLEEAPDEELLAEAPEEELLAAALLVEDRGVFAPDPLLTEVLLWADRDLDGWPDEFVCRDE